MHSLKRLALNGRSVSRLAFEPSRVPSICIYCEQHASAPRRTFTHSRSIGAEPRMTQSETHNDLDDAMMGNAANPRQPEFEYEIGTEPIADALEAQRQATSQRPGKKSITREMYKERDRIRRVQEKLDELQGAIRDDPAGVGYTPAKSWHGLKKLGGIDPADNVPPFRNFFSTQRLEGQASITAATYRALVETLAALTAGKNPEVRDGYIVGDLLNATRDARVLFRDGTVQLSYPSTDVEDAVLVAGSWESSADGTPNPIQEQSTEDSTRVDEYIKAWGTEWLKVSIEDPAFRLTFIRRLTKILGRPISDFVIHHSSTISLLLKQIAKPDPPKSVFAFLETSSDPQQALVKQADPKLPKTPSRDLLSLPNVMVSPRRLTPVDKEKSLGRWKVITKELKKRGIPVFGRRKRK